MPDSTSLIPLGHSGSNMSIRWIASNKSYVELTSACGVLRITPVSEAMVRISFSREPFDKLTKIPEEIAADTSPAWSCRETREQMEITTGRMLIRADKKSGALSFYTAKEKLLLAENKRLPRQVNDAPGNQSWVYFEWAKKEILKARGAADDEWLDLSAAAKYISLGAESERAVCILSNYGYQLLLHPGKKVLCCNIPAYGPYLSVEGETQIDYFFRCVVPS